MCKRVWSHREGEWLLKRAALFERSEFCRSRKEPLNRALYTDLNAALNTAAGFAHAIPEDAMDTIRHATYSLGMAIDDLPPAGSAPAVSPPASPPPDVNLIPDLPTVRDQDKRGTCVAHAALSAFEHYLSVSGAYQDLSEQFLYWNCKRNDGIPTQEGTWLAIAMPLLEREGCCLEASWPYDPVPIPGNEGQGPPPGGAQLEALSFRIPAHRRLSPTYVPDIKYELAAGRCVAFSVPVFNSWHRSQWVAYTGDITMPVPGEIRSGGHAMCLVGYADSSLPGLGGGRFLVRNSWGTKWGINSQYGAGYGTIPYAYIARLGAEAYSIS